MTIFSKQRLGIDLGTAQTLIYLEKKGIVLREPTVLARNKDTEEILAFGKEAEELRGRTSETIELVYPIQNGVIHSFTLTKQLLNHFMKQAAIRRIGRPEVVICAPSHVSKVERKALVDAIRELGFHRAMIVDEPFAAAIGAGLAIDAPIGRMIVDIGGGTTDIATISYGEIIDNTTLSLGGNHMNHVISSYIRKEMGMLIGIRTAETLKIKLGNAFLNAEDQVQYLSIAGRDLAKGVPVKKDVKDSLVAKALSEVIDQIVTAIKEILSVTPPELAADILSEGIYLCGGGSLLPRLCERLSNDIGLPVQLVDAPLDVVAIGAGNLLKKMSIYSRREERKLR